MELGSGTHVAWLLAKCRASQKNTQKGGREMSGFFVRPDSLQQDRFRIHARRDGTTESNVGSSSWRVCGMFAVR